MNDILSQIIAYAPNKIDTELKASSMVQGPRNMYAGGQLVRNTVDGSRPGYADMPANVYKNKQGNYVYRSGKGDNVIYKSGFKNPEAASKWGQKEFIKQFSLPNKFVNPSELSEILGVGSEKGSGMRSPFFERKDRPNYLLKEARKILGSYEAGGNTYFKAPTKKQIDYLKKYSKAPPITEGLAKNVQIILDSKAIMNDLSGKNKGGAKLPEFNKVVQVFKNAGVDASDAQITNALQKAAYLLRGNTFQTDVKFNVDKKTGNFIVKELEKLPFNNQYARGIYKHALNEIRAELGDTAGNLESFKRNLRKRLPDGFLQKHNLEINEVFSVRASFKNKSFPYAYFLDATDAEINKKALRSFHGALSTAQKNLNNKIADIRAGKGKYDEAVTIIEKFKKTRSKFKNTIETNYPGKNFNLADIVLGKESEVLKKNMKIPEDVYSKKLLDKWKNQGLDITGHAKKTGYVMTGADNPGVFTAQDLSRDKNVRNAMLEFAGTITDKCKIGNAEGGRIGFKTGSADCLRIAKEGLEKNLFKGGGTEVQRGLIQRIISGGGKMAISMLNPKELIRLKNLVGPGALGLMAAYEVGSITDDVLRLNKPLNEALAGNWLTKSFLPYSEEFAKQKNLLQSGKLTGNQKEYALEMMKMEEFMKEGKRIEGLEATQLLDDTGYGNIDGSPMVSKEELNKAYKDLFERFTRIKPYAYEEGITGRSLENEAAMNEYIDAQTAKTGEYIPEVFEDKFRLDGQRKIKKDEDYKFASSPIFGGPQRLVNKAPRPLNMSRGPMTEKGRMKLDYHIPGYTPYDRAYTPSDEEILQIYRNQGIVPATFGGQLPPGEGTRIRMGLASQGDNRSIYGSKFMEGGIASLNVNKK
jgi:hypothetical protein